jgi:hypothetical protein
MLFIRFHALNLTLDQILTPNKHRYSLHFTNIISSDKRLLRPQRSTADLSDLFWDFR